MLTGLALGALAAFFWSITNLVDKYLVDKYASEGNIGGILLLSCFFPGFLLLLSAYKSYSLQVSPESAALLIFSGVLMVAWIFYYLKALSEDDTSVVMTLLVLAPLFSFIFGLVILHELPSPGELIAGSILVIGALAVSYQPKLKKLKLKLLGYALAASFVMGLMHSTFKFVTVEGDFWQSMFWRSLGMVATGTLLYLSIPTFRTDFHSFVAEHIGKGITLNSVNETLTLVGDTTFAFAILFAPLALVQTTEGYQPVFIMIMTFVLAKLGAESFDETEHATKYRYGGVLFVLLGSRLMATLS